jgi:hypothetical protein
MCIGGGGYFWPPAPGPLTWKFGHPAPIFKGEIVCNIGITPLNYLLLLKIDPMNMYGFHGQILDQSFDVITI